MKKKVWMSWSTGKDSAYALHLLRTTREYDVVGLMSTITEDYNRVSMHAVRRELLEMQATQVNLPLHLVPIPASCSDATYAERMHSILMHALEEGVTHIAFGDLFLEDIRRYRETKLALIGMHAVFPLWGMNTAQLAHKMIATGVKAVITCVNPKLLDATFVGRQFDAQLLKDLPKDIDPCGEHGEFHTFTYAGPMFQQPIAIDVGTYEERDGFMFADIIPKKKLS